MTLFKNFEMNCFISICYSTTYFINHAASVSNKEIVNKIKIHQQNLVLLCNKIVSLVK